MTATTHIKRIRLTYRLEIVHIFYPPVHAIYFTKFRLPTFVFLASIKVFLFFSYIIVIFAYKYI